MTSQSGPVKPRPTVIRGRGVVQVSPGSGFLESLGGQVVSERCPELWERLLVKLGYTFPVLPPRGHDGTPA